MDPDANLREMRQICERLNCGEMDDGDKIDAAHRMVELFDALDEWIMKGGFLPKSWRPEDFLNAASKEAIGRAAGRLNLMFGELDRLGTRLYSKSPIDKYDEEAMIGWAMKAVEMFPDHSERDNLAGIFKNLYNRRSGA